MQVKLEKWCADNFLSLNIIKENFLFDIGNIGKKFLLLSEKKKLFIGDLQLVLDEDELFVIEENEPDFFAFEFGGSFYYSKLVEKENDFGEIYFKIQFNDLKYIGVSNFTNYSEFPYLHVHTEYELMNGSHKAKDWCKKAKFMQYASVALADKNTLAGTLSMQMACKDNNIKSILGATYTIAVDYVEGMAELPQTYEMTFYVKNEQGWNNILLINKFVNVVYDGFIPEEILLQHGNGLIGVIATKHRFNWVKDVATSISTINLFAEAFDSLFYQIDSNEQYDDKLDIKNLENIKYYLQNCYSILEPLLVNDTYYLDREMYPLKEMLNNVSKKAQTYSEDQFLKSNIEIEQQLRPMFNNYNFDEFYSNCVNNAMYIHSECNFSIATGTHKLPKYKFSENYDNNEDLFFDLIQKGIDKKLYYVKTDAEMEVYLQRIEKEAKLIVGAGFTDYFLILWDILKWSRENGIMVGTGRGSIGGCLLAYLIDIIDVDPVKYDLLFERFLNETRVSGERAKQADSLPDIDVDVASNRRDDVKNYIKERFGKFHTCSIGTFGRLKLKGAIKDFARVKGLSFDKVNAITKSIDDEIEYTFEDFVGYATKSKELYNFFQEYPDVIKLTKYCLGQAKTASIHASAVVIVPEFDANGKQMDIFNWMPIRNVGGVLISEWEGKYIDKAGFLKEDILGLSQLDKFKFSLDLIRKNYNKKIDLNKIDFAQKGVFKMFKDGETEDVFQFGSVGLKKYSHMAKPDTIEDLTAMTSLYRPGPMDSNAHIDFANIKAGKKEAHYDFGLREVTENTFGLLVYQEQIMKSVVVLGGFSLVESDLMRTVMKKKDVVTLNSYKEKFIDGATSRGCEPKEAEKIWLKLLAFSAYGFNRSHALAYSLISYQSQWLKYNYPLEFWTSSLNFADEKTISNKVAELNKLKQGISLVPPDINYSDLSFTCNVEFKEIYWSLSQIKNLGEAVVRNIIDERDKNGFFTSYHDFISRMPKKNCNKKHVACLILVGAFDKIEHINNPEERKFLLEKHYNITQTQLPEEYVGLNDDKRYFWVLLQKSLVGYGDISYKDVLMQNKNGKKYIEYYVSYQRFLKCADYTEVLVAGIVINIFIKTTKKGDKMVVLILQHNNVEIEIVIWNDFYERNNEFLDNCKGMMMAFFGKIRYDNKYKMCNKVNSTEDSFIIKL